MMAAPNQVKGRLKHFGTVAREQLNKIEDYANKYTREKLHSESTFGDRMADAVAKGMGAWRFIFIQTTIVVLWMTLNFAGWFVFRWDPYPFILLNLVFSTQAAYASQIILMSQNRSASIDRKRDNLEAAEVDLMVHVNAEQTDILQEVHNINTQQLEILQLLHDLAARTR